jgi:hypothetical protein
MLRFWRSVVVQVQKWAGKPAHLWRMIEDYAVFASDVTGSEIDVTFDELRVEVTTLISCQS